MQTFFRVFSRFFGGFSWNVIGTRAGTRPRARIEPRGAQLQSSMPVDDLTALLLSLGLNKWVEPTAQAELTLPILCETLAVTGRPTVYEALKEAGITTVGARLQIQNALSKPTTCASFVKPSTTDSAHGTKAAAVTTSGALLAPKDPASTDQCSCERLTADRCRGRKDDYTPCWRVCCRPSANATSDAASTSPTPADGGGLHPSVMNRTLKSPSVSADTSRHTTMAALGSRPAGLNVCNDSQTALVFRGEVNWLAPLDQAARALRRPSGPGSSDGLLPLWQSLLHDHSSRSAWASLADRVARSGELHLSIIGQSTTAGCGAMPSGACSASLGWARHAHDGLRDRLCAEAESPALRTTVFSKNAVHASYFKTCTALFVPADADVLLVELFQAWANDWWSELDAVLRSARQCAPRVLLVFLALPYGLPHGSLRVQDEGSKLRSIERLAQQHHAATLALDAMFPDGRNASNAGLLSSARRFWFAKNGTDHHPSSDGHAHYGAVAAQFVAASLRASVPAGRFDGSFAGATDVGADPPGASAGPADVCFNEAPEMPVFSSSGWQLVDEGKSKGVVKSGWLSKCYKEHSSAVLGNEQLGKTHHKEAAVTTPGALLAPARPKSPASTDQCSCEWVTADRCRGRKDDHTPCWRVCCRPSANATRPPCGKPLVLGPLPMPLPRGSSRQCAAATLRLGYLLSAQEQQGDLQLECKGCRCSTIPGVMASEVSGIPERSQFPLRLSTNVYLGEKSFHTRGAERRSSIAVTNFAEFNVELSGCEECFLHVAHIPAFTAREHTDEAYSRVRVDSLAILGTSISMERSSNLLAIYLSRSPSTRRFAEFARNCSLLDVDVSHPQGCTAPSRVRTEV